jgi:hypothetical protein
MKYGWKYLSLLLAVIVLAGILAGCGAGSTGTTTTIALAGENVTFTYPEGFTAPPNGPAENAITFRHFVGDPADFMADRMIFIETQTISPSDSAESLLDEDLGNILQSGPDFSLIKRTTLKIDGQTASLLAFTQTLPTLALTSQTTTTWVAYLARGGTIWQMGVMTNADLGDIAEQDFRSFTSSFKFE